MPSMVQIRAATLFVLAAILLNAAILGTALLYTIWYSAQPYVNLLFLIGIFPGIVVARTRKEAHPTRAVAKTFGIAVLLIPIVCIFFDVLIVDVAGAGGILFIVGSAIGVTIAFALLFAYALAYETTLHLMKRYGDAS
ncbi:MAG: hypothetical protein AAGD43_08415 [Pseudomonadota bacterium]